MKLYLSIILKRLASILEIFIALMLSVGIILLCVRMATSIGNIPNLDVWPNYDDLLETCFNLIIGVELIRMMYHHTPNTVFEVLLFAIARQVIIDHSSAVSSLIGVCAIAVLFATRKFLFCEFDVADEVILRGASKIKSVEKLLGIDFPDEGCTTLEELFLKKCEEFGIEVGPGASVYFHDCGLIASKVRDGKITRIQVIRAIH